MPRRQRPNRVQELVRKKAFANLSGSPSSTRQETMLHVYWSGLNDARDDGRGHLVARDKVTADLGLDEVPIPGFTRDEMQQILFAAKMQALRCIRARSSRK